MARPLTITAYGNAQVDTAEKQFGNGSLLLDGSGDYLIVTNDSNDTLSNPITGFSEPWCISLWIKAGWSFGSSPSSTQYLVANTGSTFPWYLILEGTNSPVGIATVKILVSGAGYVGSETRAAQLFASSGEAQWVNIVAQHNGGSSLFLYVNGIRSGLTTVNEGLTTDDVIIGAEWNGGSTQNHFHGWIDEILFFGENLQEIGSSQIAVPTLPFQPTITETKFLIHANGTDGSTTFTDDVGVQGGSNLTASASLSATATDNPSIVFLGREDYIWEDLDQDWDTWYQTITAEEYTWDDLDQDWDTWYVEDSATTHDLWVVGIRGANFDLWSVEYNENYQTSFLVELVESLIVILAEIQLQVDSELSARSGIILNASAEISAMGFVVSDSRLSDVRGSAELSLSSVLSASAGFLIDAESKIDGVINFAVTVTPVRQSSSDLIIEFQLEADARIERNAEAALDSEFALTADGRLLDLASADLSSQFAATVTGSLILESSADLTVSALITAQGQRLPQGSAELSIASDITVSANRITTAQADLASDSALTAVAEVEHNAVAGLEVLTDIAVTGRILKLAEIELVNFATVDARAAVDIRASAELNTAISVTAKAGLIVEPFEVYDYTWDTVREDQWDQFLLDRWEPNGVFLLDDITLQTTAEKVIAGNAQLDFNLQQTAIAKKIAGTSVLLDFVSFVIAEGLSRAPVLAQASLQSEFTLFANADNFVRTSIALFEDLAVSADAEIFRGATANLEMQAFTLTSGQRIALAQALLNLNITADFSGDLRLLASDFIYKILEDTRQIDIASETRIKPILKDTRQVLVSSENRYYDILPETREITIEELA